MPRYSVPPPKLNLFERLQDFCEDTIGVELWVFVPLVVLTLAIGRYGLAAVVAAPVTFTLWLYNTIRSFREKHYIVVFGTTEDSLTDKTANKVLSKAAAEAARQQPGAADAIDEQLPAGGDPLPAIPNAAQPQALRNRRGAQQQQAQQQVNAGGA